MQLEAEFPIQWELSYAKGIQSLSSDMMERIRNIENEVQFLVMYRHCLSNLDDPPFGKKKFAEILRCSDATLKKKKQRRTFDEALQEVNSWETLCSELVQEIHSYKKSIWENFLVFFDCSYYCSFSVMKLLKLIRYIVVLLPIINGKLQLEFLKRKLHLFERILALYSEHCIREFKIRELQCKNIGALGEWVWSAASLYLLNWALDEKDAKIATKLREYLSRSNRKFNKVLLDVTRICVSLLKDTIFSSSDENFKVDKLVLEFNRFQLENLRDYMAMDDIQLLCDGVILLTTFLMDLPQLEAKGSAALDCLITLVISLDAPEMNKANKQFLLRDFLEMVDTIQAQVKINNMELEFKNQNDATLSIPSLGSCEKVNNTIKREIGYPSGSNSYNNTVQSMVDEVVVGLESKIKDMRDKLLGGSQKLQVISIVGMPGLGKTTLAKKVFNDPSIKCHFKKSAWCTVSQSYDTKKLLLDILNDVTDEVNESFSQMEEADLANLLRKCLMGQRYLIVMDDIWDDSVWNKLKLSFEDGNKRSRILFTSRIRTVIISGANSNVIHYPLSPLTDEECWDLLERRLFPIEKKCPINFIEVGKQIAKHCEGLPLAVVLAAGLVKEKVQNLNWWEQIRDSVSLRISENGCAHIMELSYQHLTDSLKDCFLYLGLFQEDKLIGVQKLTKLWISEGFIQQREDEEKDLETLAKEYLNDLVNRSLLIVSRRSSNGRLKFCRIHDLLREFCFRKRKEIIFHKLLHGDGDHSIFSDNNYREPIKNAQQLRSFLSSNNNNSSSSPPLNSFLVSAGTFEPFGKEEEICSFFCNLGRHLQVLDLENIKFLGHFPEGLTKLSELKYLAIQCTHNYVPEKIEELRNLQTLIVRTEGNYGICIVPSKLFLMENLRHVDIGRTFHRIHFRNSVQPQMKNICSFSYPCFTSGKDARNFLRMIRGIRKLRCQFSSYSWNSNSRCVDIDFLSNLESLNMTYVGKDVPKYEFSLPPCSLKKLTLSNFKLQWSEISRINGMLQNLEVLKLLGDSVSGEEWCVKEDEKFLKLKFLKLRGLKIVRWVASAENFPFLEQIIVEQCHKLEGIPHGFGEISTLKMIQVRRCRYSVLKSAREIRREQIENGNEDFQLLSMQILEQKFFG